MGSVARVTEISTRSEQSFEDAMRTGIERANKTLRNVRGAWVKEQGVDIEDGRIEDMDVTLLDPHGGDLGGFFMLHGSPDQCAALQMDEEFRAACIDADLIVDNFGVVPAATGAAVAENMALYVEAVKKVGGHALAG